MADVFISYHVASAEGIVRQVAEQLRKRGITYWYSGGDMAPGFNFARTVPPQIDACKVFLLILDEGATKSSHVENELGIAFERIHELVIIPFRTQKYPLSPSMRYYLKHIQIMNNRLTPPLDKRIEELADRIADIVTVGQDRGRKRKEAERKAKGVVESKRRRRKRIMWRIWNAALLMAFCVLLFVSVKGLYGFYQEYQLSVEHPLAEIDENATPTEADAENEISVQWVRETLSAGGGHTVGLREDGTVVAVGYNEDGQCDVSDWRDMVEVSAGLQHTVGLRKDGTVVAIGATDDYNFGQCDVSDWRNIAAVSAGYYHTVGLHKDGTVVAVGDNTFGQCDVSDWRNIAAVSAGSFHTIGLRKDGTVVAVGYNDGGECDVSDWRDIAAVSAGWYHTVGLRKDGTVIAVGDTGDYNCGQCDVSDWRDIAAVSAGSFHTIGLRKDGTVVAVGATGDYNEGQCNVSSWRNIVSVSAGGAHTVGLRKDATVVAVGAASDYNKYGQCDVSDWHDIQLP